MNKRAFTFVELFVVIAISSLLSIAVYASFASGMKMWGRVNEITLSQRKTLLGLERFQQDIRQVLNFPYIGFSGKNNEITIPRLENDEVAVVTYLFEEGTLLRKVQSYKDILAKNEQVTTRTIIPDLQDLKLSYGFIESGKKDYTWKDEWLKEEGIPPVVRLELKTKDNNLFNRLILIPIT